MTLFLIIVSAYAGLLILIKHAPSSLKTAPITYTENFKFVWGSVCTGIFILLIFLFTTNFNFIEVDENLYGILALSNNMELFLKWPLQSATHLFIHANLYHLTANIVGLGLASVYERKVGAKRYFAVLLVGSLASIPSIFFYSENIAICGISGGIFGLAAAYFTDEKQLTAKEWFLAILLFLFFAIMLTLDSEFKRITNVASSMKTDHVGHLLGALGAILYCRVKPLR